MNARNNTVLRQFTLLSVVIVLSATGCASQKTAVTDDPWENNNRNMSSFNNKVDETILKPLAKSYQKTAPLRVNNGITNFFSNINDIGVSINDLLQLKFVQSGMDVSRFVINSTIGVGGFFDIATKLKLPKHHEDFGQTLGFWGVPSGSYMVLPLLGASSPRDTIGLAADALLNPLTYVSAFGGLGASAGTTSSTAIDITDKRADLMATEKLIDEASVDRYDFIKQAYKQHREYLIHDGNPPTEDSDDLLNDGNDTATETPATLQGNSTSVSTPTNNTQGIPVINNSRALPPIHNVPAPIINNSKQFNEIYTPH